MLSDQIEEARAILGDLAGQVGQEAWEAISKARWLLEAAQYNAEKLEQRVESALAAQPGQ